MAAVTASCTEGRAFTTAEAMYSIGSGTGAVRDQRYRTHRTGGEAFAATGASGGDEPWQRWSAQTRPEADRLFGAGVAAGLTMDEAAGQACVVDRHGGRSAQGQERTSARVHRARNAPAGRAGPYTCWYIQTAKPQPPTTPTATTGHIRIASTAKTRSSRRRLCMVGGDWMIRGLAKSAPRDVDLQRVYRTAAGHPIRDITLLTFD